MENRLEKEYEILQATPVCGSGYAEPLWVQDENDSTYIDNRLERQATIPGRSLEELKQELGIENTPCDEILDMGNKPCKELSQSDDGLW